MSGRVVDSDDEWEEIVLVAEVNGVLDANVVRQAVNHGNVKLRNPSASNPILQISNSLYAGKWTRTVGTDIILEAEGEQVKVISTTDRFLKAEKALLTAKDDGQGNGKLLDKKSLKTPKVEKK